MKATTISTLFCLITSVIASSSAYANSDDTKWIAQCMMDNKNEGQSTEIVIKYCECMNEKMSDNEIQSITQWEKTHPKEAKECDAYAGWK
jgi:hypothetical protein